MTADRSAQAGRAADDAGGWQYRLASLRMLATRALASLRRRGLLPTLRIAWRRLRPGVRARFPLVLLGDVASAPAPRFSDSTKPTASIVVPMYDQAAATLRCLHALARSGDACRFELILVDDASGEEAAKELARIAGLRYLRNASNLGFVDSCNAGAAIARGEFLVFLNNDTEVQPGWLDALLRTFRDFPDTGLAGSMLVYPDGRLQEAGGLVYSDGSAGNYGRFADPAHPAFGFVRATGYCSGAALALPRALFESLGGFAAEFRPGYYEDTDLAMRVRERGLAVRYQPASVVVHHEGLSAGTDTGSGMKAYQEINRGKFVQRWQAVLSSAHPPPPRGDEGEVAMSCLASHGRRRILVVDAAVPSPRRDSGSVRMRALMRELVAAGCAVAFTDQFGEYADEDTRALQREGIEAWWEPWRGGLSHWLRQHGRRFDAVVVSRHYVLSPLLPLLRRYAPQAQLVFDTVDLHFLREQREAGHAEDAASAQAAERTLAAELALVAESDLTWVVSEVERERLHALAPRAKVAVVSNIHEAVHGTPGFGARSDLLFVGGFAHPPNVDAVRWLAGEILPRLRERLPALRLHVVGGGAPADILALANTPGLVLHGQLDALEPLLDDCRLSVAPLRYGAGVKGKVNQAMARGLPVVATSLAAEGMRLQDGREFLLADDAQAFVDAVVRAYQDEALWLRLREGGYANIERWFSPAVARATLLPWLESLPRAGCANAP
jgi:GT2 family glycosyltransferase/glycosyltransferase involved in cell wall biosynthesis